MNRVQTISSPPAPPTTEPTTAPPPLEVLGVSADGAGEVFNVTGRHWRDMHHAGKTPAPLQAFGSHGSRGLRWSAEELREWALAGAPSRGHWERLRKARPRGST